MNNDCVQHDCQQELDLPDPQLTVEERVTYMWKHAICHEGARNIARKVVEEHILTDEELDKLVDERVRAALAPLVKRLEALEVTRETEVLT